MEGVFRTIKTHSSPVACCVAASLALGLAPFFYGKIQTGSWSAPNDTDSVYYLQIAAQPYYSHVPWLTDPSVPGGAIFYPWVQYLPFVYFVRALHLSIFSLTIVWTVFGAAAMAASAYALLWYFLRWRWLASGLAVTLLADNSAYHPFVHQARIVLGALAHPGRDFGQELFDFRITNPMLDLPFLFLLILFVARARDLPSRARTWTCGVCFAFLFYLYFYAWTLAAAALGLAFFLDNRRRVVYLKTLVVGFLLGAPAMIHDFMVRRALSVEGLTRFGMFTRPRWPDQFVPLPRHDLVVVPVLFLLVGAWIYLSRNYQWIFLYCMAAVGTLLSYSSMLTGVYLLDYHWNWLAGPVFTLLLYVTLGGFVTARLRFSGLLGIAWSVCVGLVFLSGLWLSIEDLRERPEIGGLMRNYAEYAAQRQGGDTPRLEPRAMVGGDDRFCDLAAIGENTVPLVGFPAYISMALRDSELYERYALNQYVQGVTDRARFIKMLTDDYGVPLSASALIEGFTHAYDEVSGDPTRYIERYDLRYVALPSAQDTPACLGQGWKLIQSGPSWKIWQRIPDQAANGAATYCTFRRDRRLS